MYRINSTSNQIVKLQVQKDGALKEVTLLPGNFVISEAITKQMQNLENSKVIRVRAVKRVEKKVVNAPVTETRVTKPENKTKVSSVDNIEKEDQKTSKK